MHVQACACPCRVQDAVRVAVPLRETASMTKYEIVGATCEPSGECPDRHQHLRDVYIRRVDTGDVLLAPVDVHHFAALVRMEREGDIFCLVSGDTSDPSTAEPARFMPCSCGRGYIIEPGGSAHEELRPE